MSITVRTLAVPATLAALAFGLAWTGDAAAGEVGTPPNCDPVCLAADLGPVHLNEDDVVVRSRARPHRRAPGRRAAPQSRGSTRPSRPARTASVP